MSAMAVTIPPTPTAVRRPMDEAAKMARIANTGKIRQPARARGHADAPGRSRWGRRMARSRRNALFQTNSELTSFSASF